MINFFSFVATKPFLSLILSFFYNTTFSLFSSTIKTVDNVFSEKKKFIPTIQFGCLTSGIVISLLVDDLNHYAGTAGVSGKETENSWIT